MRTYNQLFPELAAYMRREEHTFLIAGNNILQRAVNNARDYAQRSLLFHRAFTFGEITLTGDAVHPLSDVTHYLTRNKIALRSIVRAAVVDAEGNTAPIPIWSYEHAHDLAGRDLETAASWPYRLLVLGSSVTLFPAPSAGTSVTVRLWGPQWLPEVSRLATLPGTVSSAGTVNNLTVSGMASLGVSAGDLAFNVTRNIGATILSASDSALTLSSHIFPTNGETYIIYYFGAPRNDFLVENMYDFLLFRSIFELNLFLKEDQRVGITAEVLQDVWRNVVGWNETVVLNSTEHSNLN